MSSLGDLIGSVGAAFGDTGHNSVERLTKNPAIQTRLDALGDDYDKTKTASSLALDKYIADYLAGGAAAKTRTGQETSTIDRYYNGDVERQLASLRARQSQAGDDALNRSLAYMTRSMNSDRIMGSGGGGSYDRQLALRTGGDMSLQALMANLNQERADQEYLRQSQLGLAGRRTAMDDALAMRQLVPSQAMKSELGWNLGTMGGMTQLDQLNNFYGVKYNPSGSEMAGDIVGDVANVAMDIYSGGASSMLGGMMGGGGKKQPPSTNWMGPSGGAAPSGWEMPGMTASSGYIPGVGAGASSGFVVPPIGQMYSSIPNGWGGGW